MRELLNDKGAICVHLDWHVGHYVKLVLDEVFGPENFCSQITFLKTSSAGSPSGGTNVLPATSDFILWYAKDREQFLVAENLAAKSEREIYEAEVEHEFDIQGTLSIPLQQGWSMQTTASYRAVNSNYDIDNSADTSGLVGFTKHF